MKYALNNGDIKQPNFLVMFFTMNKQKPSITQRGKIYIKTGEGGRKKGKLGQKPKFDFSFWTAHLMLLI